MKITVVGAGAWGTTLAGVVADKGISTSLWVREAELAAIIKETSINSWFLPDVKLPQTLAVSSDLSESLDNASYVLMAVPCQFLRPILRQMRTSLTSTPVIVCCSKGIEIDSLKPMSGVVHEELGDLDPRYAVLSGPSFAREVSQRLPTAVTLGTADPGLGAKLQNALSTEYFRVYLSQDYRGVELGGALKNVMAIATGISDGLEFGTNARASLITRGLAEISRLGEALGANAQTFMGLSGLGDLVLTCTGDLSRNRQVGLRIGRGESLESIVQSMNAVAEGVKTTQAVHELGRKAGVELPITDQVYDMLYANKDPKHAVHELMTRTLKEE
ncbi:MAG: NAD(P)H-dependent glycerol-3-phosphate dehydrogenase [Desulfovermiculus sp.]